MSISSLKREFIKVTGDKELLLMLGIFILTLLIFVFNAPHERYPDEFDNILGGKYLLSGKLIYSDWFSHHGPSPYFLSAFLNIFSGNSFVHFRYMYAIVIFGLSIGSYIFIKKRLNGIETKFYLFFLVLLSLASTYFWGHMLLADNLSAYLILPVFGLIILKVINKKRFDTIDYSFISAFSFLALMSSLTYSYLIAGIYIFLFVYYFTDRERKFKITEIGKLLLIIIIPYFLFLIYLLITKSFDDYLFQAIKFNRDYYIYYPGWEGKPPTNPLRYAILITQGFHNNFSTLLISAKDFNFNYPFNITLALANLFFGIYLLVKKKYLAFLFVLGSLIFANVRTNPLESRETDYQSAVYILISLFNLSYLLPAIYREMNKDLEFGKKLIFSMIFLVLLIYTFFSFTFLLRKFSYKSFNRYMGLSAGIYDGPKIAPYLNRIVDENSYSWIGPFAVEDLYYLNTKIPSKYHVYLPGMSKSDKFRYEIVSDFEKNKPDVIYFDKDFYILGEDPKEYARSFRDYLKRNFILLGEYPSEELNYSDSVDKSYLMEERLFINKDKADDIINRMDKEGMIKR